MVGKRKKNFFSYFISKFPNFSHMDSFRKCSMFRRSTPLRVKRFAYDLNAAKVDIFPLRKSAKFSDLILKFSGHVKRKLYLKKLKLYQCTVFKKKYVSSSAYEEEMSYCAWEHSHTLSKGLLPNINFLIGKKNKRPKIGPKMLTCLRLVPSFTRTNRSLIKYR